MKALYEQTNDQQFNFENDQTKMTYAKAKLLISFALLLIYLPLNAILQSKNTPLVG